jgi:hypothetical protein
MEKEVTSLVVVKKVNIVQSILLVDLLPLDVKEKVKVKRGEKQNK